jgi:hypothetical protein
VIFTTERFYGMHTVPNDVLALLAFRRAEPNVARLAVGITLVDGETDVIVLKLAVALEGDASGTLSDLTIDARGQERVATLGTEKVLFVVRAFSEFRVVEGDETFVDDRRLAMITTRSETLYKLFNFQCFQTTCSTVPKVRDNNTHLVVIEMAVRLAITLVRTDVLEQIVAI